MNSGWSCGWIGRRLTNRIGQFSCKNSTARGGLDVRPFAVQNVPRTPFFGDNYLETGVKEYFIWRNAVRRTAQSINSDMNRYFLAALGARAIEAL